jgi:Domain of unknown function (DUF5664)
MEKLNMEEKKELKEGIKFDKDKLRVDLIPVLGLLRQADVYTRGAKKYSDHNWRFGMNWSRIIGAMIRHALWFAAGEQLDPSDGQHHLSSVAWCANTLMEYEVTHPELDDRYIAIPPEKLREVLDLLEGTIKPPDELVEKLDKETVDRAVGCTEYVLEGN